MKVQSPMHALQSRGRTGRLLTLGLWLLTGVAHADALPMEPECPEGTVAFVNHYGAYCGYRSCEDASDCAEGQRCQVMAFCEHAEPYWASFSRDVEPYDRVRYVVDGTCDAACPAGSTCVAIPRCTDGDVAPSPIPPDARREPLVPPPHPPRPSYFGCGRCGAQAAPTGGGIAGTLVLAALWMRRRARRTSDGGPR